MSYVDVDKLLKGQLELLDSIDYSAGTLTKKTGTHILYEIEYSAQFDDYNTVSASVAYNWDGSINAEYQVSTKCQDEFSFTTILGAEIKNNNNSDPTPDPQVNTITIEEKSSNVNGSIFQNIGDGIEMIGDSFAEAGKNMSGIIPIIVILLLIPGLQPI